MPDRGSSPRRARRRSGLRSSALATALVGASVLVGTGLFVSSAAAAALCATPPLTGTTSATGVIDTYYPGLTTITAGTASTTVTVGASRGSATPIAVGDLVLVVQMQGAQIDSTNTDAYGDGVSSATASGYLNTSFIAGQYEYATVRSVVGAVVGLNGAGANGGLVNTFVNADESATQGQQRFQVVRVPQYSSATFTAATPPLAVAWDGSSGGIVALDVANDLNLNGTTIDTTGQGFRPGLQRTRSGATGLGQHRLPHGDGSDRQRSKGRGHRGHCEVDNGCARYRRRRVPERRLRSRRTGQCRRWRNRRQPDGQRSELGRRRWRQRRRRRPGWQHVVVELGSWRSRRSRGTRHREPRLSRRRRRRGQRQQRRRLVGRWSRRWHGAGACRQLVGNRNDHRRWFTRKRERTGRQRRWWRGRLGGRADHIDGCGERHWRSHGQCSRWRRWK